VEGVTERFGGRLTLSEWHKLANIIMRAESHWRSPDHGMWEPRHGVRHNARKSPPGGGGITSALDGLVGSVVARTTSKWDDELVSSLRAPTRLFIGVLLFRVLLDPLALNAVAMHVSSRLVGIITIAVIGWVAVRGVTVLARWVEDRAKSAATDAGDAELRARGVATQVRVFRRVLNVSIGIITASLMLMQFEVVRNIGVSLLASAGLAGVVLGFAAQRTIGSLIAGIQMSTTQPIRIGDVVIIEKEWGTIEEITLTYVVVKVWDERRLIVPMTRFLEQPFENWTKTSAAIHGTVYFYVDWTFPVEAMRSELDRILDGHPDWDGRTKGVVVTDAKERSLEVRVLVSAANAGKLWDLRVDVREKIVRWLQQLEGGRFLARVRYEDRGGLRESAGG
jgi:small-conductance mechanosensitive channel